jgi:sulfite exporter TauE/SafE
MQWLQDLFTLKYLPYLSADASCLLIFAFGILTSFHCVAMCGGIALSQTAKRYGDAAGAEKKIVIVPSALYNAGRIVSYTLIGAVVGALGQAIGFSGVLRSLIPMIGGLFMVVMAINLLDIFPALRRLNPRTPRFFAKKVYGKNNYGPFVVGLLTGLMPCGPLQMMQIYALGTKNALYGAAAMFVFALGAVPLLFLFGVLNTFLNRKFSRAVTRAGAVLVLVLGISMIGRGLALAGIDISFWRGAGSGQETVQEIPEIQKVSAAAGAYSYPEIVVRKDLPVEFTLFMREEDLNDCNNALVIPKLGIEKTLVAGENVIRFTPEEEGAILYTCWMGMIKSTITVVD